MIPIDVNSVIIGHFNNVDSIITLRGEVYE